MIVKWAGNGLNVIPAVDPKKADPGSYASAGHVVLYPGYNDVPDAVWNFCKLHAVNFLENKMIEEIANKGRNTDGAEVYVGVPFGEIADKRPSRAVELVNNCYNRKNLEDWKESTGRDEVRRAIERQIASIEAGEPVKK